MGFHFCGSGSLLVAVARWVGLPLPCACVRCALCADAACVRQPLCRCSETAGVRIENGAHTVFPCSIKYRFRRARCANCVVVHLIDQENLMDLYQDGHPEPNIDITHVRLYGATAQLPANARMAEPQTMRKLVKHAQRAQELA
jgi:hypothetical protein